ncbi:MAG: 5'-nucleotidase C-terminal domain-containing protein [Roseiflexus sp.]|nr:5'-nucleotidase C-terminal domain-containing protein [Roseiflexus sp.]
MRSFETNSGNLVADAFLASYDRYASGFGLPARRAGNLVIAVQNGGGMRQTGAISAGVLPQGGVVPGPITRQNTLDLLAFLTNVTTVVNNVTPQDLKLILERSAAVPGGGQFLQIAGFTVTCDLTCPAQVVSAPLAGEQAGTITVPGERVREVICTSGNNDPADDVVLVQNGEVVADAPNVRIVTNSFTAGGGDNYAVFEDIPASRKVLLPATYEQALVEYLLTFPVADGLPTIPASDPRYAPNVNQRIFGVPLAP